MNNTIYLVIKNHEVIRAYQTKEMAERIVNSWNNHIDNIGEIGYKYFVKEVSLLEE